MYSKIFSYKNYKVLAKSCNVSTSATMILPVLTCTMQNLQIKCYSMKYISFFFNNNINNGEIEYSYF